MEIKSIIEIIRNTPNDQELGKKLRTLFFEDFNNNLLVKFLNENNIYYEFLNEFNKEKPYEDLDYLFLHNKSDSMDKAFTWNDSMSGFKYWHEVSDKFRKYYLKNR